MTSEGISYFPRALTASGRSDSEPQGSPSPDAHHPPEPSLPIALATGALIDHSDSDLLVSVGTGSRDALAILFRRHARTVHGVCRRILRDEVEAEDLMQDVFIYLWTKASLFDPAKGSAVSWIFQVTYCRAFDRKKYLSSRHYYDHGDSAAQGAESSYGRVSITEIAARTLLERVRTELSMNQFQTLDLCLFQGYSLGEIATDTGQSIGTVRHHYYRGLERIRSYIFPTSNGKESADAARPTPENSR